MWIDFTKYHGAGNDFVIINKEHNPEFPDEDQELISQMCDRHFGIGADGLITIDKCQEADFRMIYYNADGQPGSLCGNGTRCAVHYAHSLKWFGVSGQVLAADGLHKAYYRDADFIEIQMNDPNILTFSQTEIVIDTGSPHYIEWVDRYNGLDLFSRGRTIRYSAPFKKAGINVNFVLDRGEDIEVRTYERGVEDMTLACGTGCTAAAIAWAIKNNMSGPVSLPVKVPGGQLQVRFNMISNKPVEIWLGGPAVKVFKGAWKLS